MRGEGDDDEYMGGDDMNDGGPVSIPSRPNPSPAPPRPSDTARDVLATIVMFCIRQGVEIPRCSASEIAAMSYEQADAMLAEREKGQSDE